MLVCLRGVLRLGVLFFGPLLLSVVLKFNVDGTSRVNLGPMGIGGVHNDKGEVLSYSRKMWALRNLMRQRRSAFWKLFALML